jgi:hypothetical protein
MNPRFVLANEKSATKGSPVMNDSYGWMGGGMWLWTVACVPGVGLHGSEE